MRNSCLAYLIFAYLHFCPWPAKNEQAQGELGHRIIRALALARDLGSLLVTAQAASEAAQRRPSAWSVQGALWWPQFPQAVVCHTGVRVQEQ